MVQFGPKPSSSIFHPAGLLTACHIVRDNPESASSASSVALTREGRMTGPGANRLVRRLKACAIPAIYAWCCSASAARFRLHILGVTVRLRRF